MIAMLEKLADQEHNTSLRLMNSEDMVDYINIPYTNKYS
ncbi:conserved hypothetical protein [Vibrio chagasii]|nr:conserved hypothetical protein [Vibrio chagasii]CAH6911232.1 conserved hypothetical protein [Vibrio chagasii]CAH6971404.1 conserved hypothetical protein [Vibrio chagasii]CAH7117579.1 conserved hypothetical protein [Vibrio chagasii]CAH7170936.1 conserved hypothetical protein [Vibrio chagasii]